MENIAELQQWVEDNNVALSRAMTVQFKTDMPDDPDQLLAEVLKVLQDGGQDEIEMLTDSVESMAQYAPEAKSGGIGAWTGVIQSGLGLIGGFLGVDVAGNQNSAEQIQAAYAQQIESQNTLVRNILIGVGVIAFLIILVWAIKTFKS